ncbi:MAG: SDR family NAD(P)-dependent oxidoreductase [Hyphomicrobiaceae bacterium]
MSQPSSSLPRSWILRGPPRDGARVRLVCFPHGGGGPQAYRAWPDDLPDWIDIVSVNPPGRGARLREMAVDDMSVAVGAILRDLTPYLDMPVVLFGHSVGALVAFEVARALGRGGLSAPLRVMVSGLAAPEVLARGAKLHDASDDTLLGAIAELGLLPADSLGNADLRKLLLGPLRADFALCERHTVARDAGVACPLTALGGRDDALASEADLAAWRWRTTAAFDVRMFPGGHFYTQTARDELLGYIVATAEADLAASPPSVVIGDAEDYPLGICLHELFRLQAAKTPDALALSGIDGTMTFAELDRNSDLLARRLLAAGMRVDGMAAIFMETSADYVVAYLAALKAGGAYLPIPLATPDRSVAEILDSVGPCAVITRAPLRERIPEAWRSGARCVVIEPGWQAEVLQADLPSLEDMGEQPGPDSLAYCVMTSGTTGKPKGIVCPHMGAVNSYWWRFVHLPYSGDEREACNVFFVWEVLRPLLQGLPAYVIPDEVIFDPRRLIAYLDEHRVTRILFTPSLFERVLNGLGGAGALPHLRMVILNGEVVSVALRDRARALLPHVALVNDYSISECHDVTTSDISEVSRAVSSRYVPAGRVMANVRIYVLDDDFKPVPWGVTGEIYVAGPNLARGYLDLPEMTAERFLPDPVQGGDARMFRTGDVGRLLGDGQLEVKGRSKFMIKLRGYSVVLSAVEAAIASHAEIGAVAVVTADDAATGQPDHLVAYVVGREGAPGEALMGRVRAHLKDVLPAYAIPAVFVPLAEMPIALSTGKIDRTRLPAPPAVTAVSTPDAPQSPERVMARMKSVWRAVLGREPTQGSDNFFDLGGHSLLAIELALAAETSFGVRLDVIDVFDHPTLEALTRHVEAGMAAVPVTVGGRVRATTVGSPDGFVGKMVTVGGRVRATTEGAVDVAVIAMACRFPGADSPEALWRNLVDGVSSIRRFSDDELAAFGVPAALIAHPDYVKAGAVLDGVADFDPRFFGLSEREAALMDPQQRLFIACCWEAMERAGHVPGTREARVGVFAGCYLPSYLVHHLGAARHLDPGDPTSFHLAELGNDKDYLASRVAYLLDLDGPAISVQTSCSTGLVAIAQAAQAIQAGQCDMALAGASSLTFPQGGYLHVDGHIAARDGVCRTFDARADGTILGDGVGVVVLRRLDDALRDGDNVLAVIKGFAVNNDGARKAGYSAPSVRGQADVVRAALDHAGIEAGSIGYVEAHGTATPIGDPIEVRALAQAFARDTAARGFCALGSIKPNIGHANIAAGTAGFIKAVLALQHRQIPPQINYETANPELRLAETPFYISTALMEWTARDGGPRRAGVSSFGIGGTNVHVVLEEAPEQDRRAIARTHLGERVPPNPLPFSDFEQSVGLYDVLPLSARSAAALDAMRVGLAEDLERNDGDIGVAAATLQLGRLAMPHRRAVVAGNAAQAVAALRAVPPVRADASGDGGIVFLFPGQGAQHAGMAAGLMQTCPAFARHFGRIAELFAPLAGRNLHDLFAAESDLLATAAGLQPALFAVELALAETLIEWGIRPAAVAGHSLGQYVAAVVGGVLALEDAVRLVAARARATDEAPPGAMVQVAASAAELAGVLGEHSGACVAGVNSVRDVVVAGSVEAVEAFAAAAGKAGFAVQRIAVTRAFHSPMMAGVAQAVLAAAHASIAATPHAPFPAAAPHAPFPAATPHAPLPAAAPHAPFPAATPHAPFPAATPHPNPLPVKNGERGCAVACNVTGGWMGAEAGAQYWARHVLAPVRFADNAAAVMALRPSLVIEIGPGATLTGLMAKSAGLKSEGSDQEGLGSRTPGPRTLVTTMRHVRDRKRTDWEALCEGVARVWEAGGEVDWRAFREGRTMRRAVLPTYPFERRRCWPADDVAQMGETRGRRTAERKLPWQERFYVPSRKRSSAPEAGVGKQSWLVLYSPPLDGRVMPGHGVGGENSEVARSLCATVAEELRARGHAVECVAEVGALPVGETEVRVLWCASPGDDLPALLDLARELIAARRPVQLFVVAQEASAAMIGPLLSLTQEVPSIVARMIVVDEGVDAADLVAECAAQVPRREPLVALRGSVRWVERFDGLSLREAQRVAGEQRLARGPHIITGGLGRIGMALGRHLAGLGADVVLVTRSAAGIDDDRGGKISVLRADVSKAGEIGRVFAECLERQGRIGGVFHAAGLAKVEEIRDVTAVSLAEELAPKVAGTEFIAAAIARLDAAQRPEFVMAFSSLAATLGGLGLGSYAAANRFMDAFVASLPVRDGVPWIAAAWDDWDFDYGGQQMGAYAQTRAALSIAPEEGFAAIAAILGEAGLHTVLVSVTDLDARIERWVNRTARGHVNNDPMAVGTAAAAVGNGLNDVEQPVRAAYGRVLGGLPGLDDDFFALGGDSLLATQIVLELSRGADARADLRIADVFDFPSIKALSQRMLNTAKDHL